MDLAITSRHAGTCRKQSVPPECWSAPFCLNHFLAERLVSVPLLATSVSRAHFDVGALVRRDSRKHRPRR